MAEYLPAYNKTVKGNEAGYANDAQDKGKRTYCGISEYWFPNEPIWALLEKYKPLKQGQVINDAQIESCLKQFYCREFWNKIKGNAINSQEEAEMLFDSAVNVGLKPAIKMAQQALGLEETGVMDDSTLNAINNKA